MKKQYKILTIILASSATYAAEYGRVRMPQNPGSPLRVTARVVSPEEAAAAALDKSDYKIIAYRADKIDAIESRLRDVAGAPHLSLIRRPSVIDLAAVRSHFGSPSDGQQPTGSGEASKIMLTMWADAVQDLNRLYDLFSGHDLVAAMPGMRLEDHSSSGVVDNLKNRVFSKFGIDFYRFKDNLDNLKSRRELTKLDDSENIKTENLRDLLINLIRYNEALMERLAGFGIDPREA